MVISLEIQKQSLDYGLESFLQESIKKDNKLMYSFAIAANAIKNGKYQDKPLKKKLKLNALKNQFSDLFLCKFLKRKEIIINIKNNCIINYFKYDYVQIMKELDSLLWVPTVPSVPTVPTIPKCNCRNKGFGFCFHK